MRNEVIKYGGNMMSKEKAPEKQFYGITPGSVINIDYYGTTETVVVEEIHADSVYPIRSKSHKTGIKNVLNSGRLKINGIYVKVFVSNMNTVVVSSTILNDTFTFVDLPHLEETIADLLGKKVKEMADKQRIIEIGANVVPEVHILEDYDEAVEINVGSSDSPLHERFVTISGNLSELTSTINSKMALGSTAELAEAFLKTKEEISKLSNITTNSASGLFSTIVGKSKWASSMLNKASKVKDESADVQTNIDYLFGLIHSKYEKLMETGEALQKAKGQMNAQIAALMVLEEESKGNLSIFKEQSDIPMKVLSLDTQIKATIEKYNSRLLKINGAIVATQTTIVALGKDLPGFKTDLTDEMAIGGLLSDVDDYQKMYSEIATLVAGVTEDTAEKTHKAVEGLLDLQINDHHVTKYLLKGEERTAKFSSMLTTKYTKLEAKVHKDAEIIATVSKNSATRLEASANIRKLLQ